MARKTKETIPIAKFQLIAALENTYEDSSFIIDRRLDDNGDFLKGICSNRSEFCSKAGLIDMVRSSPLEAFPAMPEFPEHLVLSSSVYVYKPLVNHNQIIDTVPPEGYQHVLDKSNPHYEIYFKIDFDKKTISFRLGKKERTLLLHEHSGYCWKPGRTQIYCEDAEKLEKSLRDPFFNPIAVDLGYRILRIKPVI